jgi:hypothetical protein
MKNIYKYKMDKKNMKRSEIVFYILFLLIILSINFASASCQIESYAKNSSGSYVAAQVNTRCENTGEMQTSNRQAGQPTSHSFGGPGDSCSGYCSNIWVNATNSSLYKWGVGDKNPMNNTNEANWSSTIVIHSNNVTLSLDIPIADTIPPQYANISEPADPSVYGTGPYKFNISWEDNVAIDNVVLTFDGTNYSYRQGGVQKISTINSVGAIETLSYNGGITGSAVLTSDEQNTLVSKIINFIVNIFLKPEITGQGFVSEDYVILGSGVFSKTFSSLSAGAYNYSWWANDTSNLQNSTYPTYILNFTVTQAANPVTLTLGGFSADRTITYGTTSNAVASAIGTVYLYRNNALVNQGVNPSENIVLANGTYVYFANSTGNENYSANLTGMTFSLFINKNSSSCALTVSSVTYPAPVTASCSCNNPESSYKLFRNNADVTLTENNQPIILGATNYNYTCNVTSTQNYTNASQSQSITVSRGNPPSSMHLFLNGIEDNSSNTVGETSNITAYSTLGQGSSDLTYKLYNNSILVMAGNPAISMPVLPVGSYNYIYNTSGGTNWTSGTTALRNLNVSTNPPPTFSNEKKSPTSPAYIPGQNYYFNITVYDLHNISSAWIMNNFTGTGAMQNYSANFSGNSSMREYSYSTANLAAGTYAYQWFANDTFGQPGSTSQYPYTISQNTTSITVSLSPSNNVTYGTETTAACTINNGQAYNFTRDLLQISSPDVKTLGVNTYNYMCSFAGNQNYTGAINSSILNVSQSQSSLTLSALSWVIVKSSIATINCSANNAEAVLKIYSNNSQVNTSTLPANFLSYTANFTNSGLFNITCNRTSSQNYTYASASNILNVTLDITAPNITIIFPTGTVGAGTTSVNINISTDETAICRYNRTNSTFDFANGINFTITNAMSHTFSWNVSDGQSYTFYYKCNDTSGNVNPTSTTHSFSVASPTPPSQPGGGGGGGGAFPSCIENWNCSDWSDCINGKETRTCNDVKNCGTTTNRPEEQHKCAAPAPPTSVIVEYKYFVTEGKEFAATASKNSEIIFYVPEQGVEVEHKLTILDVDNVKQEANIVITSEPIYITLKQNVSQQVDLNNDSINDIEITLKGTSDGNAQIAIRFIGKKPAFVIPAIPSGLTSKIYFIIAALIIVIIIIILVRKKGKRAIKHAKRIKHRLHKK